MGKRIDSLQSWRFIFALVIFFHHFTVDGQSVFLAGGTLGVAFFLILSGFVMSAGYADKVRQPKFNYKSFFAKRLSRVYPLHLLCLILAAGLIIISRPLVLSDGVKFVMNSLLLQSWIPLKGVYFSYNAVSWCLSDLLFFYAVFPFLSKILRERKLKYELCSLLVLLVVYFALFAAVPEKYAHQFIYISPVFRLFDFAIGIMLYNIYSDIKGSRISVKINSLPAGLKSLWEMLAIVLVFSFVFLFPHISEKIQYASFWWFPICVLILTFAVFDDENGGGHYFALFKMQVVNLSRQYQFLFLYDTSTGHKSNENHIRQTWVECNMGIGSAGDDSRNIGRNGCD